MLEVSEYDARADTTAQLALQTCVRYSTISTFMQNTGPRCMRTAKKRETGERGRGAVMQIQRESRRKSSLWSFTTLPTRVREGASVEREKRIEELSNSSETKKSYISYVTVLVIFLSLAKHLWGLTHPPEAWGTCCCSCLSSVHPWVWLSSVLCWMW